MTDDHITVSVVIIFHNEERFLQEAIDSVLGQTYRDWELLLVDDGSSDASTAIAKEAVAADRAAFPSRRIRYLTHDGGRNRGMSAARNLGIGAAKGRYIASLDGDDVWLPDKLNDQVAALERHPEAAMVFGPLLRWRTWTGDPDAADHEDLMGVGRRKYGTHPYAGQVVQPPTLLRLMLKDDYFIPGGALIRRDVLVEVGLYEERFRGMYEDAVVMTKVVMTHPVLVSDTVGYLYRMHPDSHTNRTSSSEEIDRARAAYLEWIGEYLADSGRLTDGLHRDLQRARRSSHARRHRHRLLLDRARAVGRLVLPLAVRDGLRRRWRDRTRPMVAGR